MIHKRIVLVFAGCLFGAGASLGLGQEVPPTPPPKVLRIFREEVKPGKAPGHEKLEASWASAFARANFPTHYLAMTSVSGPSEAWFLEGQDSIAGIEQSEGFVRKNAALSAEVDQFSQQDGELLAGWRVVVALYRPELSYRTENVNIGQMRYFYVTTWRVHPGHGNDFIEANKIVRAAHEQANVPEHWAVFEVTLGMPSGTFLVFQPLKSLADVDAFPQTHGEAFREAMGEAGRKKLAELQSAGILSAETNIFAFNPKMSYVSKEMAAADPDFWTPKPKPAGKAAPKAAPVPKKEAAKPGAKQ